MGEEPPRPSTFNADVDASLDAVVLHALVKDREARYQDATAFRGDLQAARLGRPISAAARGTAAGAAGVAAGAALAEPTMALDSLSAADQTTMLGTGAASATGTTDAGVAGKDSHGNTASLPAIGHDPDDEPRQRRGLAYVLLVLAVLGAIALMVVAGMSLFERQQPQATLVTVPSVVDIPVATAEARVRAAGLVPEVQEVASPKEDGTVVDQNPQANERVSQGSKVTLSVSSGPNTVDVPDVAGFSVEEATARLKEVSLTVAGTEQVNNTDVEKGKVVETKPASGQTVNVGSAVTLRVSSGKVEVPDVVGMTRDEAAHTERPRLPHQDHLRRERQARGHRAQPEHRRTEARGLRHADHPAGRASGPADADHPIRAAHHDHPATQRNRDAATAVGYLPDDCRALTTALPGLDESPPGPGARPGAAGRWASGLSRRRPWPRRPRRRGRAGSGRQSARRRPPSRTGPASWRGSGARPG